MIDSQSSEIRVEMAEFAIAESPKVLIATGIGSCIGVCLYAKQRKTGALAHIMLPYSEEKEIFGNPLRYADRAIDTMLSNLFNRGIQSADLAAKIVGGANMFPFLLSPSEQMGTRNAEAVKEILTKKGVKLTAEHVGGNFGRSLRFELDTGIVTVEVKI